MLELELKRFQKIFDGDHLQDPVNQDKLCLFELYGWGNWEWVLEEHWMVQRIWFPKNVATKRIAGSCCTNNRTSKNLESGWSLIVNTANYNFSNLWLCVIPLPLFSLLPWSYLIVESNDKDEKLLKNRALKPGRALVCDTFYESV